ncbi:MAG TPA: SitI3 family protein [Archangium sp.]|uniref:SitI3 family protein n=1 Tax=Archangium sp. TaxID=1872627 RepID=UPI002E34E0DA|nr:SitI3 family protein [Archangium sp.]HEX5748219.1 SitI3 family protein [Archangium sp.]
MAIEYDLHLSTQTKPRQALEELASQISGLTWSQDRTFLFDASAQISPSESRTLTQKIIKDAFHFTPTLRVGFRRLADADWDRFRDVLLDASLLLLDEAQDAVLLFNGERIEFQRLGGQLVFNAESGYWRDEGWLRSRLPRPFDWRPLSSPML